jgi:hypothetical protein
LCSLNKLDCLLLISDVEQMFYQFRVTEYHRDYIRFFSYQDNDFSKPLIEYRMTSHVFGNAPSPAVATYGLRHKFVLIRTQTTVKNQLFSRLVGDC